MKRGEREIFVGERLMGQYIYRRDELLITMHEERATTTTYSAHARNARVSPGQKVLISIANRRPHTRLPRAAYYQVCPVSRADPESVAR